MKVTIAVNGRFWHFHLARQLERYGLLERIYTSYPSFKLKDEEGIPKDKITCFPGFLLLSHFSRCFPFLLRNKMASFLEDLSKEAFDTYVCSKIYSPSILIGISGSSLKSGKKNQTLGGAYICDRGSTHIRYQEKILRSEYHRWDIPFAGISGFTMRKELSEYCIADLVTVPSQVCVDSFVSEGVEKNKIIKNPYGSRDNRFFPCGTPSSSKFCILWVGGISIRKAFFDALHAFQALPVQDKSFKVVGIVDEEIMPLLKRENLKNVEFLGKVPNLELPALFSASHVFVISSIEEGLAMVVGEAMACGCPVIASENSGASELLKNGVEGFIVPIRSPQIITEKLLFFYENPNKRFEMGQAALVRVKDMQGWDRYGQRTVEIIDKLDRKRKQ
jgi:glycosyltransferase involved in cell wall biosynthesis